MRPALKLFVQSLFCCFLLNCHRYCLTLWVGFVFAINTQTVRFGFARSNLQRLPGAPHAQTHARSHARARTHEYCNRKGRFHAPDIVRRERETVFKLVSALRYLVHIRHLLHVYGYGRVSRHRKRYLFMRACFLLSGSW